MKQPPGCQASNAGVASGPRNGEGQQLTCAGQVSGEYAWVLPRGVAHGVCLVGCLPLLAFFLVVGFYVPSQILLKILPLAVVILAGSMTAGRVFSGILFRSVLKLMRDLESRAVSIQAEARKLSRLTDRLRRETENAALFRQN